MNEEKEKIFNILNIINKSTIKCDLIEKNFSSEEIEIIRKLYIDGSIVNSFDREKGYEIIVLTRKGKFLLFNENYKDEIEKIASIIENNGYRACYLGDYLNTCDLDKSLEEIFSIEDYELFIHNLEQLQNARVARRIMLMNNRNI